MNFDTWKKSQDLKPWHKKYIRKKLNAKSVNIGFSLTFDQYLYKAYTCGLNSVSQVRRKGDSSKNYHLARYKDLGDYTVNNCRFTTQLENIQERNTHFDVSSHIKKQSNFRVKNKTHHFLNGELQRKQVRDNKHPLAGKLPWENKASSTLESLEVWKNADKIYTWHMLNPNYGDRKLKKSFNFSSRRACQTILHKFKKGWNPNNDKNWIEWKVQNV